MIDLTMWILTSAIFFAGGYYLGVSSERERAARVIMRLVDYIGINQACKIFQIPKKGKK